MLDNHQASSETLCSVHQLCLTLCDPIDCSPPGSFVHGILQARILERVAISSSSGSSPARGLNACLSCTAGAFFTAESPGKPPKSSNFAKSKHMPWWRSLSALVCPLPPPAPPRTAGAGPVPGGSFSSQFLSSSCLLRTDGVANPHHPCFPGLRGERGPTLK